MPAPIIFIIGVSGSGKSTIGQLLSARSALPFFDGDDFHPPANVEKMKSGQPLDDDDRMGWLEAINHKAQTLAQQGGGIFACSALKEKYRKILAEGIETQAKWVLLDGTYDLILARLQNRKGHFMPLALLQSQFDILEHPEEAIIMDLKNAPETIIENLMNTLQLTAVKKQFGLIGLGVMGKSLARNLASKGFPLALFNREVAGKEESVAAKFIAEHAELSNAAGFNDLSAFVQALEQPRKIFLMVNAGAATDAVINDLLPLLSEGDTIIDGGNAHYKDTERRMALLASEGLYLLGAGVSGGEEGALKGPSIMAGGEEQAYLLVQPFLEAIAAKDYEGQSCCALTGAAGAGHFVKMVHNGIEYAEMQLLAETYDLLRRGLHKSPDEIAAIFEAWEAGEASSYLLEITIDILRKKTTAGWLLDEILDVAANKGTGAWATIAAAELGVPATLMSEALFARYLSTFLDMRQSSIVQQNLSTISIETAVLREAYQIARIVNHHQGIQLIAKASEVFDWNIRLSEIARIWTNGCIIRSTLMEQLVSILKDTERILAHPKVAQQTPSHKTALTEVVCAGFQASIEMPCLSAALNYLNGIANAHSAINLVQAQRDYFGAHTYQRRDDPQGAAHHTNWKNKDA